MADKDQRRVVWARKESFQLWGTGKMAAQMLRPEKMGGST